MSERYSEAMRARWADPQQREKLLPKARESVKKALVASVASPNKNRSGRPPHSEASRAAARAGMLAAWADPVRAARMRAAQLKAAKKSQELRGGPIPDDPTYRKARFHFGAAEARRMFKLPASTHPPKSGRAPVPTSPPKTGAALLQKASNATDD